MNRGDTAYLLLDYTVNEAPLTQDGYQELELQINRQSPYSSVKKLLSDGGITWEVGTPIADGSGYVYVPSNLVSAYQSSSDWSVYNAQIRAIGE